MRITVLALLLIFSTAAAAVADHKIGKSLHDKQCTSCHMRQFGGDGSRIYTRSPRLINDKTALGQRVTTCASLTGAKWFPEDVDNVVAYLNQQFYKFP